MNVKYRMTLMTPEQIEYKRTILKRIGYNLKQARLAKGYSMEHVARDLLVTTRTYAAWEAGEELYSIPAYSVVMARNIFKIPIARFFELMPDEVKETD